MQRTAVAVLLALAHAGGSLAASVSVQAQAQASAAAWLQQHRAAQPDELAELKTENPQAYAIVKALLTKRALGLLDPKHPSASFAPSPSQQAAAAPVVEAPAPEPVAKAQDVEEDSVALPALAPTPAHQDWLNWRPQQSAVDDEAMVNSVLGAAAELKPAAPATQTLLNRGRTVKDDEAEAPVAKTQHAATEDPAEASNPYLNTLGVSASVQSASVSATKGDSQNYLSSFSWNGDKPAAPVPTKKVVAKKPKNALLNWLSAGKKEAVPQPQDEQTAQKQQPEQASADSNPYLAALQ